MPVRASLRARVVDIPATNDILDAVPGKSNVDSSAQENCYSELFVSIAD